MTSVVFLIQCPDQKGLVSRISTFFYDRGFNILNCQQYTDIQTSEYYMRLKLDLTALSSSRRALEEAFDDLARPLNLRWSAHYSDHVQRVALLVTRASHCLYDVVLRQQEGELACEIPVIISNQAGLESAADRFKIPFHFLPVSPGAGPEQENSIRGLLKQYHIDVVVLARYMQILSESFVDEWAGKIINIHHAFLPAFQGANPYRQAYERGVKLIGATAHYATSELDEGPIIEQDVQRVTHEDSPGDLSRIGRDIERVVLARALRAHLEHRIILSGRRTVVFSTGM